MTTICLSSIKGGVGKTSIAIMLSKLLAKAGKEVLCMDMDIQNSLSFHFLDEEVENRNIALALHIGNLPQNIVKSNYENIDIIQSSFSLVNLRSIADKALKRLIPQVEDLYDFCIIDTAPTWDNIVLNAINAADYVISPARLAQFDLKGARFYQEQLVMDTSKVEDWYILLNFFKEPRTDNPENLTNQYLAMFSEWFDNILDIRIPNTSLIQKSIDTDEPISDAKSKKNLFDAISRLGAMFLGENETYRVGRF